MRPSNTPNQKFPIGSHWTKIVTICLHVITSFTLFSGPKSGPPSNLENLNLILSLFKAEKYGRFYTSMSLTRRAIIAIVLMSLVFLICYSIFAESDMISHRVVAVRSIIFENSEKMKLSEKP